jgi:hypothetical protein
VLSLYASVRFKSKSLRLQMLHRLNKLLKLVVVLQLDLLLNQGLNQGGLLSKLLLLGLQDQWHNHPDQLLNRRDQLLNLDQELLLSMDLDLPLLMMHLPSLMDMLLGMLLKPRMGLDLYLLVMIPKLQKRLNQRLVPLTNLDLVGN